MNQLTFLNLIQSISRRMARKRLGFGMLSQGFPLPMPCKRSHSSQNFPVSPFCPCLNSSRFLACIFSLLIMDKPTNRRQFLQASVLLPSTFSLFINADEGENRDTSSPPNPIPDPLLPHTLSPIPPDDSRFEGEPNMQLIDFACDLLVAGGGPSGVCATLAAARNGAKVILVQDRSRLGGNSSSEIKMHIVGANNHRGRPGWREGGILEELRLDDAVNNPQRSWEQWDLLLYDKIVSEENATLLLDTTVYAAEVKDGQITRVMARCDKTEILYRITAKHFADCTGDARLAMEAGATIRWGHESREDFNEPLAWEKATRETLGSSILFTARDYGKPMPYKAPSWARKIEKKHLRHRPIGSWEYGYWWIEWGGKLDTIRDNETIRKELLAIVTGTWDYIKNSGQFPSAENWAMDWVGMVPGKRESRRIEGDHILTQQDLMGLNGDFEDAVCIGGWPLDEHPPGGFDDYEIPPYVSIKLSDVYNIPLRSLYSKDIANLFMAGRNASCSHVAFTSTRVMATCASMGQALGTAAALCKHYKINPRGLYEDKSKLKELQQTLLRDDQTIKNLPNEDEEDLARQAGVKASHTSEYASPENVINGWVRDMENTHQARWAGKLEKGQAWLELHWEKSVNISRVHLTFDTGFHRELTLTAHDGHNSNMIRAAQPETVRDYAIQVPGGDGQWTTLTKIIGNHQRLRKHPFPSVQTQKLRLLITATNGLEEARLYEIRCYA
jgi:hypothetical protein